MDELYLGIELGSTRIKALAIDKNGVVRSYGDYQWNAEYENGIWTYDIAQVWEGIRKAVSQIQGRERIICAGVSGMMHGYLAFDKDWNLLVPFRTWQNTITAEAAEKLSRAFGCNIPQRWSIAHFYQAILNKEHHVSQVAHITTLAGYVHYMLTGFNAIGIDDASGMFPIDIGTMDYDSGMLDKFTEIAAENGIQCSIRDLLPEVLVAGENAGSITEKGSEITHHLLFEGLKMCPPEGDAGTGMVATDSAKPRMGNVSAGTSIFSMVVLEKPLKNVYPEIDIVCTPGGKPVAMVHCNNCTRDMNDWIHIFNEVLELFGVQVSKEQLFTELYRKSLDGDPDCGSVVVNNYIAGEGITHIDDGHPFIIRKADGNFTLGNLVRAHLYSTMVTLKIGMDILRNEKVKIDRITGHGGLFKTQGVCQQYMADALNIPVTCMQTAEFGGPYGMALLAEYAASHADDETLEQFLDSYIFKNMESVICVPDKADSDCFNKYAHRFEACLELERAAIDYF